VSAALPVSQAAQRHPGAGADEEVPRSWRPVTAWAAAGGVLLAFEVVVLARWVFGPNFKSTPPGPDQISSGQQMLFTVLQVAVPLAAVAALYFWVARPWRREGHLTTDGMLTLSAGMVFFWDMSMNYTSVSLLYNSHLVNRGAWANGSWPGWISPNANDLPESLFITIPGYVALVFSQVVLVLWILRKIKARRPKLGTTASVVFIFVGLVIVDTIIETVLLRSAIYAYPGAIRDITLFGGHTYQVPLSETVLFGGVALGAIACLSHFRDDRGHTVVERGLDKIRVGAKSKQLIKFLAIFGAVHLAFLVLYMVPQQWFAVHSGPFPSGYKSYMINDMCASGSDGRTCPGPGVPMPRPPWQP
jgi:Spirocyclase AveC-like